MATMVKEKRREKKKTKPKTTPSSSLEQEQPTFIEPRCLDDTEPTFKVTESDVDVHSQVSKDLVQNVEADADVLVRESTSVQELQTEPNSQDVNQLSLNVKNPNITEDKGVTLPETDTKINTENNTKSEEILVEKELHNTESQDNIYQDLNTRLERITIPSLNQNLNLEDIQCRLENPEAYLQLDKEARDLERSQEVVNSKTEEIVTGAIPSAPVFEEEETPQYIQHSQYVIKEPLKHKVQSMPLEEAVKLYGGAEMERVKAWSEKEEAIVEAGPVSGPEHPLVDLLSTFRSSLIAVDRERLQLSKGYVDEEKFRKSLWRVETRFAEGSEECAAGSKVTACAKFEHAEFLKERLPVAKMKLEGLLRDVQDSYCHHQHAALLTHCQIQELISETTKSNKKEIREALALVLKALRLSDNAPTALAVALQRWAAVLSASLLDARDICQLLHLLHHLFRQTRSVRWASRVIRSYIRAGDRVEAAQTIAVLDLLLARPRLESAVECTEDADESWEEMDKTGSGAVCDGSLRERDILALLRGFPLRDLVARIVLFQHSDVTQAREYDWGDRSGGSGVLKACCGARALLNTLQRGVTSHPTYNRLHAQLRNLAAHTLHALAGLHLQSRDYYSPDLEEKITAELEACFCAGFNLLGEQQLQEVPTVLLNNHAAREYCCVNILALHDKSPKQLHFLPITLPVISCGSRVRTITQAALDRLYDHELARTVMEFLFQTGIKRKPVPCKGACEPVARELLPSLLDAHGYLHTLAFHTLAEYYQMDPLDPSSIDPLAPHKWRPTTGEVKQVLEDWSSRCPSLIQHLLMKMDYTPHSGVPLETQLTIGSWLCAWLRAEPRRAPPPEWAWSVLRRMRVHRTSWRVGGDAPPPDPTPDDLFSMAFAVLSSSWGHCVPLICSEGVDALCKLAASRAADAAHCLAPVMIIMAHSPESVALTPKFTELFSTLLAAGPTLVQRALGLGPEPGADVLLRLILKQLEDNYPGISRSCLTSAWLHALWKPSLPSSALLDTLLLATRDWATFDAHVNQLLKDKNALEIVNNALRNATTAPMLCLCVARGVVGVQAGRGVTPRVCQVLHLQRTCGDRIHVDNALKYIGANMSSEDLAVYKCAAALQSAPPQRPSHLMLWALFTHLYLQRPPDSMTDTTSPCGPLFFSGFTKSRVFAQVRKKLQETITYHHDQAETLKQNHQERPPQAPARSKHVKKNAEDGVLPMLSIKDLSGESSESSESDSENSEQSDREETSDLVDVKEELALLLKYHTAAESMCKEFLRWLDEGNKTRAMPYHADIARFIPEQVLDAAWSRELASRRPLPLPEATTPPVTPTTPRATPFQSTAARILNIKDCSHKRSRRLSIKSPLEDIDCKDARTLLKLVDKHLANLEALAEEWCNEVARLASLDSALWELVAQLRVRKALPPVRKSCAHSTCRPVTIHLQEYEWCISLGAESGIDKNRQTARSLTRRLARPRPHAARSAAALLSIARHIGSCETAVRAVERAWQCARSVHTCAPAQSLLTAFVDVLADRWLSHNGKICSELLSRWGNHCSSPLQQSLCGALVSPRRLQAAHCVPVYCAVLKAPLPPHIAFSFLSKFELSRWVEVAEPSQRRELLEALISTAQRWGITPDEDCYVLLELLGVHTATLLSPQQLCPHITRCTLASVNCTLPPSYWSHVNRATEKHAVNVPFDQLGHLLRELGVFWWEARSGLKRPQNQRKMAQYCTYATPAAELLHALIRAFTAAAVGLSYSPERVALYVWSALQESWGPWITPQQTAPLLTSDQHTDMVKRLVDSIRQVMLDCAGIEEHLLARIFEWIVPTYFPAHSAGAGAGQECRVQLYSLLEELRALPWTEHQWFLPSCLQHALQACSSNAKELQMWCSDVWRGISAATWARGASDDQLAPLLASLLYLFTAMQQLTNTLEQATRLPWWRLPQAALEEALERFFVQHHNPSVPYHELPQFKVILFASELRMIASAPPPVIHSATARHKRATAVSRWVCSACAPALSEHVTSHSVYLLRTITDVAPYLEVSEGEVSELLGRALAIMCIEPAAAAAAPVWCEWVSSASPRLIGACVSAASILTAFEYFAALADASIRAYCDNKQCGGWSDVFTRLSPSPWREAGALVARTRLHAAYAALHTHAHTPASTQTALLALLAADVDYIQNEAIVSVWICCACRTALSYPAGGAGEGAECGAAARALLARMVEQRQRSLLKMVTLQADGNTPTSRHRLLASLALCIVSPSESATKAYEAACSAVLGSNSDVLSWGRAPKPKQLPRLAIRLFPNHEKYFKLELDLAPKD